MVGVLPPLRDNRYLYKYIGERLGFSGVLVWPNLVVLDLTFRITGLFEEDDIWDHDEKFMPFVPLRFELSRWVEDMLETLEMSPAVTHLTLRWTSPSGDQPPSISTFLERLALQPDSPHTPLLPAIQRIEIDATEQSMAMLHTRCFPDSTPESSRLTAIVLYRDMEDSAEQVQTDSFFVEDIRNMKEMRADVSSERWSDDGDWNPATPMGCTVRTKMALALTNRWRSRLNRKPGDPADIEVKEDGAGAENSGQGLSRSRQAAESEDLGEDGKAAVAIQRSRWHSEAERPPEGGSEQESKGTAWNWTDAVDGGKILEFHSQL
ncbi:hypothetical protein B0H17DRAFT_1130674 [Mycena rosella]|uniref:Uncharacterized protein n=1 Tax=Mycena rosella TaxID=1033263 RepID=A0AAD7GN96_MYCRO|nr:hypothetical protein B0H17DRAFT_1130674 [Mycena rosella]